MEIVLGLHQRIVLHSVRVTRSARVKAIAAMITMRSARKVKLIFFAILTNIWLLLTLFNCHTPCIRTSATVAASVPFDGHARHGQLNALNFCYLCMYNIIALRELH